jgi:hypothetical protein
MIEFILGVSIGGILGVLFAEKRVRRELTRRDDLWSINTEAIDFLEKNGYIRGIDFEEY